MFLNRHRSFDQDSSVDNAIPTVSLGNLIGRQSGVTPNHTDHWNISSVRDRLRREGVDSKLGGVNRFTTVADVIDHFLAESQHSAVEIKSEH